MNKKKTIIITLFVMLLWGTLFPTVKLGYSAYGISTTGDILYFAGIRFTICGIIISLFSFLKDKESYKPVKHTLCPILLSGIFAIVLHYAFTYMGLMLTESSKTAILKQVGVLFYVCFSFIFLKEDKVTKRKIIAGILGFLGIVAINLDTKGFKFNIGDLFIILASFCTVFSNVISKKVFENVKPVTATGISQLFGGVVLLVFGKLLGGSATFMFDSSISIMIYICFASIVSYCLWFTVVKKSDLSGLFIIKFSEPLFACVFGAILLGENIFKIQYLIAFLLVSSGIVISNKNSSIINVVMNNKKSFQRK